MPLAGQTLQEVPADPTSVGMLTTAAVIVPMASVEQHGRSRVGLELYYTGRQRLDADPFRTHTRAYLVVGLLVVLLPRDFVMGHVVDQSRTRLAGTARLAYSAVGAPYGQTWYGRWHG